MSVKPEMAFDVCWEVYRGAREVLEAKRGVAALNWEKEVKFTWKPELRPKLKDWVADFALACSVCIIWDWRRMKGRAIFWG